MQVRRLFGVPLSTRERNQLSENYLSRRYTDLRQKHQETADTDLVDEAVRQITGDLDDYLNQIAARSQTLLAVVAIMIAAFLQIGSEVRIICWACVAWALSSFSLFYNIWLFFGTTDSYAEGTLVYRQTVKLAYQRSLIFNGNIIASLLFCLLVVAAYAHQGLAPSLVVPKPAVPSATSIMHSRPTPMVATPTPGQPQGVGHGKGDVNRPCGAQPIPTVAVCQAGPGDG